MIVPKRVYRTKEGRLVNEGDPQAAFLAYAAGDEVADSLAKSTGLAALLSEPEVKQADQPLDKSAVRRTRNKSAPGVVADTSIDGEAHVLVTEPGSPLRNGVDK